MSERLNAGSIAAAPSRALGSAPISGGGLSSFSSEKSFSPSISSSSLNRAPRLARLPGVPSTELRPSTTFQADRASSGIPKREALSSLQSIYEASKSPARPTVKDIEFAPLFSKTQETKIPVSSLKTLWQSPRIEKYTEKLPAQKTGPLKKIDLFKNSTKFPDSVMKIMPELVQKSQKIDKKIVPMTTAKQTEAMINLPLAKTTHELLVKAGIPELSAKTMVVKTLGIKEEVNATTLKSISPEKLTKVQIKPQQKMKLEYLQETAVKLQEEKAEKRDLPKLFFVKDTDAATVRNYFLQRAVSLSLSKHKTFFEERAPISGREVVAELPGQIPKIKSSVLKSGQIILDYIFSQEDRSWDETRKEVKKIHFDSFDTAEKEIEVITSKLRPVAIATDSQESVTDQEVKLVLGKKPNLMQRFFNSLLAPKSSL